MNEMLPESTRCVTGSAVNMGGGKRLLLSEGWRDYNRTRWSYRSDDGLPVTLLGKFTDKNLLPVLISLLFRRRRRRGEGEEEEQKERHAEEHLSGKGKGKSLSWGWIVWGVRETTGFSDQSVG